jgi:hypothetical protein
MDIFIRTNCIECEKPHQWSLKKAESEFKDLREMVIHALCDTCRSKIEKHDVSSTEVNRLADKIFSTI